MTKKILLSGVKPTGRPHIGNYFGVMRQYVDLQDQYESWVFVANLHALTTLHDRKELYQSQLDVFIDYLAIGIDPEKTNLYLQSAVPQVTELAWILECLTTMPYLERAHAYKDAVANGKEPNGGLFNYPMLMAADILLPDADIVPVGKDQKQHIEYARDAAEKFNRIFGETFKMPQEYILKEVEIVPGIDGRKMSKSYNNHIPLFAESEEIRKLSMSVVTSSVAKGEPIDPETDNVFALHKLVATENELHVLEEAYRTGAIGFKESKELLAERLERFIAPLREKRREIARDPARIKTLMHEGGEKAYERYEIKMKEVREKVGLI